MADLLQLLPRLAVRDPACERGPGDGLRGRGEAAPAQPGRVSGQPVVAPPLDVERPEVERHGVRNLVLCSALSVSQSVFTITERALTMLNGC